MAAKGYTPKILVPGGMGVGSSELAHRSIDLNRQEDRDYLNAMTTGIAAAATSQAWVNFRRIGEVRYAISRSARIAGYATLRGERLNLTGSKVRQADSGVVAEIVNDISARFGGTRGLIERFYTLRKVPGQMYFAGVRDNPNAMRDGYWFLSPSELALKDSTDRPADDNSLKWVTARTGSVSGEKSAFTRIIEPRDFYGRIWSPDHEYLDNADTPMIALNDLCEMLHKLTESIMGRLQQRFTMAGMLLIPSEINDAAISGDLPGDLNYGTNDKVLRYLIHIMTRNVMSHGDAKGQLPILLKGPAAVLDQVRHVIFESQVAETDLKLRSELLDRILDGLDQQKRTVQETSTNRFTAWSGADEERRITVQPDLDAMCHALTRMVLWRELKDRGWSDERIRPWRVWYDISAAAVRSNLSEEARQAFDRGEVNGAFLRMASGASNLDVMDPKEYVRWVGSKVQNPILMTYGLEGIDVDWDKASGWGQVSGPAPDSNGEEPQTNPGVGDPGAPGDRSVDDATPEDGG